MNFYYLIHWLSAFYKINGIRIQQEPMPLFRFTQNRVIIGSGQATSTMAL